MGLKTALLLAFLSVSAGWADSPFPPLKVVPWNGHKAAVSLAFDGSDPFYLDVVIPELNKRKMRATFFLTANQTIRKDEWRKIPAVGDEIGSRALDGKRAKDLTPPEEEAQVTGARHVLQKEFGIPIYTFSYPFGEVTAGLRKWVMRNHFLALGRNEKNAVMKPKVEPDWLNLAARDMKPGIGFATYKKWIDEDFKKGGWLILRMQGSAGVLGAGASISRGDLDQLLDYLCAKEIWVGTFQEVGAYFQARWFFEKRVILAGKGSQELWEVPKLFPSNVFLKLKLTQKPECEIEIQQTGQKINSDAKGIYMVFFNKSKMSTRLLPTPSFLFGKIK